MQCWRLGKTGKVRALHWPGFSLHQNRGARPSSVKSRIKPKLGFKIFDRAAVTIAGVELLHRIRKGQFNLSWLRIAGQAAPAIWNAVLSA